MASSKTHLVGHHEVATHRFLVFQDPQQQRVLVLGDRSQTNFWVQGVVSAGRPARRFLILRLGAPQRRFPRLQTFRPFESPDVFGGRAASGCLCRFFILRNPTLTAGYERLSLAFLCRSLLPGLERLPKALNGFFMSHTTCFDLQSSTMRGSLWPFYVDRIHPSCLQRSWKLSVAFSHRVLNICKLGLIISL